MQRTGSKAPVEFSNLWEGENAQQMYAKNNGFIEDHMYGDPLVVAKADDFIYKLSKSPVTGKPFIVGELNQAEGAKNVAAQSATRSMLPLAAAAYGSLQNWSGLVFFAWTHGDKVIGSDGWAEQEKRESDIGHMVSDGMQLDHLRTCGMIFRRGLVDRSVTPVTMHVDDPIIVGDYNGLMRGKYAFKAGWQDIHQVRKSYGPVPADQATAPWMTQTPANPLVSDTKQISKDLDRRQLTVAAPKAEAFSGYLDGGAPAALKHLELSGDGFATVVMVADDNVELAGSMHLIISRTNINAANGETEGPVIHLAGLKAPGPGQHWQFRPTRPRDLAEVQKDQEMKTENGQIVLPGGGWHECELEPK